LLKKRGRVGWVVGGSIAIVIFIVTPVYFSLNPSTPGWVGIDNSKEKSQVTTEEIGGKTTKTQTCGNGIGHGKGQAVTELTHSHLNATTTRLNPQNV